MSDTILRTEALVVNNCPSCGVTHAFPEKLETKARENHDRQIYCPNGHPWHYTGKTDAQKAREDAAAERRRREHAEVCAQRMEDERDASERRLRATRGVVTRTKRRLAKGICPCCTARFDDLAAHMTEKHPEYAEDEK